MKYLIIWPLILLMTFSCAIPPKTFNKKIIKENLEIETKSITKTSKLIACEVPQTDKSVKKLVDIANSCLRQEKLEELSQVTKIISNEYTQTPWANYYQSIIALKSKNLEKALVYINDALFSSPNLGLLNFLKANILEQMNYIQQAEVYSKKATELTPKILGAHQLLVSTLMEQSKYALANDAIKKALKYFPNNLFLKISAGDVLLNQEEYRKALGIFKVLPSNSGYKDEINYKISHIYSKLENEERSIYYLSLINTKSQGKINKKYQDNILEKLSSFKKETAKIDEKTSSSERTPAKESEKGGAQ